MGRPVVGRKLAVDLPGFRGRVHVREDGRGDAPPLLLLHGFSGSLHWFDPLTALLAVDFRVVRIDLLGHGATGGPAADAPLQAEVVADVIEQLGLADLVAVGHSFGADVAVDLAERSARVSALVILTQAPDYSDATFPRASALMTRPLVSRLLTRGIQGAALALTGIAAATRNRLAVQAMRDVRALNPDMFHVVLVHRRARMARRPLDAQMRRTGKPALVVLGSRDHFYGDRSRPRYQAAGADVVVLPHAGHSPHVEDPAPAAALIRDFAAASAPRPSAPGAPRTPTGQPGGS